MKVIVFDFEVFKYNTLLGVYEVNNNKYVQLWDAQSIKEYYLSNINSIWIGHNNTDYDNYILQSIVKGQSPWLTSQDIINNKKRYYLNIKLNYYDLMQLHPGSLKVMEAAVGKNISESSVDFNLDRPLTNDEKLEVEKYNRDDLDQTFMDLQLSKSEFQLKLDLIKEFNLSLNILNCSEAQMAEQVLKVKKDDSLINNPVNPTIYPQMRINNQEVLNYYLSNGFRTDEKPIFNICGLPHQMGAGGIHAARKNCKYDWAYYFDVSGYYNLTMINYNLFSRAMDDEAREKYTFMYHEQLRLKKIDPIKRAVYKKVLLAVFGAQMNEHSAFYDPWNGALVPIVGQLFLVDLLEKLEGKVELIQSNTDGIIAFPLCEESELKEIVDEWQQRTGFVLKFDKIFNIYQRDVNNYMYRDDKGKIHCIGEAIKYYEKWENPLEANSYMSKTPIILHYCIVEYLMNGIKPESTIVRYAKEFRLFQWILKTGTYDYLTFENQYGKKRLQKVNRCFASKESGAIYKNKEGKHDSYASLSEKVFIFNEDLSELDFHKIDYVYYARAAYERIDKFLNGRK